MLCWDSFLESPSQKQFMGGGQRGARHSALGSSPRRSARDNRTPPRTRPADSLRVTIMTVEQCADGSPSPVKLWFFMTESADCAIGWSHF